jgi:hypothetical protein
MRADCPVSVAGIAALLLVAATFCYGEQGGSEWVAEKNRDWELSRLRSQAASLDSQRRVDIDRNIRDLEWQRKTGNFSESDFTQRAKMDWDVRRIKSDIWQQENEQRRQEQQIADQQRAQALASQQQAEAALQKQPSQTGAVSQATRSRSRRTPEPLTGSEAIRARWGWGASALASPEERERMAYHQQQRSEAQAFLNSVYPQIERQNAEASKAIIAANYASDLIRLLQRYPLGLRHPDAQKLYQSKMAQLVAWNKVVRAGESVEDLIAAEQQGISACNEMGQRISEAEASLR